MVRSEFTGPALREAIERFDDAVNEADAVAEPGQRRLLDLLRHDQLRYVADAIIVGRLRPGPDAAMTPDAFLEHVRSASADLSAFVTERDERRLTDATDHVDQALYGVGVAGPSAERSRGSHRLGAGEQAQASNAPGAMSYAAPGSTPPTKRSHGRHAKRSAWPIVAFAAGAAVVAVLVFVVASSVQSDDPLDGQPTSAAAGCTVVRIVVPASYQPAVDTVADDLAQGSSCVDLDVTVADGRTAEGVAEGEQAHVWVTDDAAWLELYESSEEYESVDDTEADEGPPTLATSPILFVSRFDLAAELDRAGGGWGGLAALVDAGRPIRIVTADPASSGDGLLAVGGVGDAIWDSQGMDASALLLARAFERHRTVAQFDGSTLGANEIALVPEHQLSGAAIGANTVTVPDDRTVLMRYSWHPTEVDADSAEVDAARDRLFAELTAGASADDARAAAHLRDPRGQAPSGAPGIWADETLPPANPVMDAHKVSHVFATWYAEDRVADVLVVVDVSGSMALPAPGGGRPLIALVRDNVRQLGGQLPDDARLGVWGFGSQLDGQRDYVVVAPLRPLTPEHRDQLDTQLNGLVAQPTGTGLHDTIIAAYRSAHDSARPGIRFDVMVFTDGRNQDDPGSASVDQLRRALNRTADPDVPVGMTVVQVGGGSIGPLAGALEPVGGEVVEINNAKDVVATFIHLTAGGLHG
jgi:Mg-chelatase subunit ChlD